jgi:hypothetical protein
VRIPWRFDEGSMYWMGSKGMQTPRRARAKLASWHGQS